VVNSISGNASQDGGVHNPLMKKEMSNKKKKKGTRENNKPTEERRTGIWGQGTKKRGKRETQDDIRVRH